jgi:hypothetical protein
MKLSTWLVLGGLGLGGLGACGKAGPGEQVGGGTHWLKHCSGSGGSGAECGPELECVCGVCTAACEADSACAELGSDAQCARSNQTEFAGGCTAAAPERICVRAESLEPGSSQEPEGPIEVPIQGMRFDGTCLRPPELAGYMTTDNEPLCDDALTFAFAGEDCWRVPSSCLPDGFVRASIEVITSPCFTARECSETPSCGEGEMPAAEGCLSCDAVRIQSSGALRALVQANGWDVCSSDLDCIDVQAQTGCDFPICTMPLAASSEGALRAAQPALIDEYCSAPAAWAEYCQQGGIIVDCAGPAICRQGRCVSSNWAACPERSLDTCAEDGDCVVASAFPLDTDQQCFAATSVPVACVDPDLSCPPVTTPALDGEGNCFSFGNCLPEGFARAPEGSACAAAAGTSTCAP